jgi:hypothetical protein
MLNDDKNGQCSGSVDREMKRNGSGRCSLSGWCLEREGGEMEVENGHGG